MLVLLWCFFFCSWPAYGSAFATPAPDLRGEPSDKSTFRLDYRYYPPAGGWLKLHRISTAWFDACHICYLEGVPLSQMPIVWAPLQPDNLKNKERCLAMTPQGSVADVVCDDDNATRPFFCYKKKESYIAMNKCGYNDHSYQVEASSGHCYKFHTELRGWHEALTVCTAEGGTLTVINSGDEAKFLVKLVSQHNYKSWVHIGFNSWTEENGTWITVDGNTLKEAGYDRWLKGEPNNLGGKEFCGCMNYGPNGLPELNDCRCAVKLSFICEIPSQK